eukprot:CAMPEP_0194041674 /NCGR_PEP_ID=MMETSP0009_2-20130614/13547_1 /TAXON_ID=210454 /ORGANISM="Grammatophora oceanica, Strain CCMP 410" /LENGTH=266 /DNA_ID=CAMNT_0038685261 /DNA_START=37 /DNA_END=833 /DNA_ORIENTATION=-
MTSKRTFLEVNNEGIQRLGAGEYEKASELFKEAFDEIKSVVGGLQRQRRAATQEEGRSDNNNEVHSTSTFADDDRKEHSTNLNRKGDDHHDPCIKKRTVMQTGACNEQRRKRRRMSNNTPSTNAPTVCRGGAPQRKDTDSVLCRPLWLEQSRQAANAYNLYTASILYNYAYTLHQAGIRKDNGNNRALLRKAMETYANAIRLSVQSRCRMVLWMSCHNLQQLLFQSDETEADFTRKYAALENHKATVLRLLTKNLSCDDMCILVVS